MIVRHLILYGLVLLPGLAGCQRLTSLHPADLLAGPPTGFAPPPMVTAPDGAPYIIEETSPGGILQTLPGAGPPTTTPPPIAIDPSFNQPYFPPAEAVAGPPPGALPGLLGGTAISPALGFPAGPDAVPALPNPLIVPAVDDELAWEQIADVTSDYFRIARERRARKLGDQWLEGRIETAYQDGATLLEPHRSDSVGWFNLWESTFQTIRRRATLVVSPVPEGYSVFVEVKKELEDLPRPERANAGVAVYRFDGSLPDRTEQRVDRTRSSPRWLSLGRDMALEQKMLAEIQARLGGSPGGPMTVASQ